MRKTKIVCTIGPASESEEILAKMCHAGMNVARLNFSHGTHENHRIKIDRIKKVRRELGLPIAIMLDTKGPEYRIRAFENQRIFLKKDDLFTFTTRDIIGNDREVSVTYSNLIAELEVGDVILLNNGLMKFVVESLTDTDALCRVVIGGELSNNKSMSFPGKVLHQDYVSEQDRRDILFGIENDVDYIACSFVSQKSDLLAVQKILDENGGSKIELIAKIENQSGIDNIEEICEACDGIMIGRGDLGVEISFEKLPAVQKEIITKCRLLGKRVITATEMLESMTHNARPTRAEISDVANAVYDGTSAVMLSAESAAGDYPVETVETMARIVEYTEKNINYGEKFLHTDFTIKDTVDAISHATCGMAIDIDASVIVACSLSGITARMVSRFRSPVDIIGLTTTESTWRKLALSWGVTPMMCEEFTSTDVLFYTAKTLARQSRGLNKGDKIVITGGDANGRSGTTNLLKVEII